MSPHEDNPWSKEYEDNQTTKKSDVENMRWKTGEHTIRITPSPKKGKLPFAKYIVHWIPVRTGKKDRPIIHAVDQKCAVCKFVNSLWSEIYRLKEEEDMTDEHPEIKKLLKQISKIRGKKTYDMNIIHRGDYRFQEGDHKGKIKIKRLVAGPTIWKAIIELGNSAKWGNPSAAGSRGYDLTVTVDGEGIKREYTILPDPDRRPLTEEELAAVEERAYDLDKLRKFTTDADILDILENAKAPLDTINLKKVKKDLEIMKGDDEESQKEKPIVTNDDDDDEDQDISIPDDNEDDVNTEDETNEDAVEEKVNKKESSKEDSVFSDDSDESKDESSDDDDDDDDDEFLTMDCRGTYDSDDVGCQDCDMVSDCKKLKKEFIAKTKELDIDVDENMSGVEIEKAIKKKEKELEEKKNSEGKNSKDNKKAGKASKGKGKRKLPF